jgi:hypothetical protein
MSNKAVLENVRRYRSVASLFRQTAAFRPIQRHLLLAEAAHWEHLALSIIIGSTAVHGRSARGEPLSIRSRVPEPAGAERGSPRLWLPLFQCLVDRPYRIEDGVSF